MRVAFLFPGQGSQRPGMLRLLPDHPAVRETLQKAEQILDQDVRSIDSPQALASSVAVQLATFIAGVCAWRALRAKAASADAVAGLSAGAFAAAVASGALGFPDALRLVRLRGLAMDREFPQGYGMSAIIGLTETEVCRLLRTDSGGVDPVYLAGVNAPRQIVLAGTEAGLKRVMNRALASGARRSERLAVSVPSHCPLLARVAGELGAAVLNILFQDPEIPYLSNRTARLLRRAREVQADLAASVCHPVRWHDMTASLFEFGVRLFVEMPPGHTLTDLATAEFPEARSFAMELTPFDSGVALIRHHLVRTATS